MISKLTTLTKKGFMSEFFAGVVSFEAFVKGSVHRSRPGEMASNLPFPAPIPFNPAIEARQLLC